MKNHCLLSVLAAALSLIPAGRARAQTFTTLYSFTAVAYNTNSQTQTNSDGANPQAGLILSGNTLYGTASEGGAGGYGTVFKVNTDGAGYATLYSFTNGSDGAYPRPELILSGNTLYGTASDQLYWGPEAGSGGGVGGGTVFEVNTDGTGFATLYGFTGGSDGSQPRAGLVLSGNTLYGTASDGGAGGNNSLFSGDGTLFEVNTDGTGFATLHGFTGGSDGVLPEAELILSGNTLYGTALGGGTGSGTVFKVNPDGAGYATVYRFTDRTLSPSGSGQNGDGANPQAGLVLSGNTLYGTASEGGTWNNGTVFKVNTDGTGFRTLHIFSEGHPATNSDGVFPVAGLILSGNTLYGTASEGGAWNSGTVFQVNTNGTGFRTLHNFSAAPNYFQNSDGMVPQAGLILSGNTLYGTASEGGAGGYGTIFSITLPVSPPPLTITASSTNVTLMWPTNAAGFTLQSRTNLASSAVWTAVSAAPVVVNGQNIVTNPISGTQQFYRLQE